MYNKLCHLRDCIGRGIIDRHRCRCNHLQNCRPTFLVSESSIDTRSLRFLLRSKYWCLNMFKNVLNPRVGRCRPGIRFRRTRRNFTKVVTLTSVANMLNKMSIRFCKNYFVRATTLYCNQVTWLDSTKKSSTRSMSHPESCIFVLVCTLIQNDSITNFTVYFDCRQC